MYRYVKIAITLVLMTSLLSSCSMNYAEKEQLTLYGPYQVIRVIDGDTLIAQIDDVAVTVRLIGVDTPESVHPEMELNTVAGDIASDWIKNLLQDEEIYIEYDVGKYDKYDRPLAYVYIADGSMVNTLLLKNGLASVFTVQPNVKYANDFLEIQVEARKNKVGFWKDVFTE